PVTLLGWLPWTVFVVAAFFWAVREFREHELAPLDSFLIIWIGVTVVFFSISKSKLPGYILPAIPAGVLLLVGNSQSKNARRPKIVRVILHAFSTAVLIFVALDLRYTLLRRHFEWNRALIVPFVVSALLALVIVILILKLGRRGLRIATLVPAVVTLSIAIRF